MDGASVDIVGRGTSRHCQLNDDVIWIVARLAQFSVCHLYNGINEVALANTCTTRAERIERRRCITESFHAAPL